MSYNSLHKCLIDNRLWVAISVVLLGWYLSPLFHETFYVPVFDNLDSNVVLYKILAESGMIFAPNDAIIPNMMNGLPRSSYGSEFDIILWLYYFFEPKTAYIINEVAIHLIAFFSMFIFLKSYVVKTNKYYGLVPVYIGSLYFALLPYWSGAGATIALLPLVTYALLNIKNNKSTKWDWFLLVVLPIYSDFILLYMFYIIMAGLYMIYDAIQYKKLNKAFFFALFLMGTMFLLREYRLVISMFFDPGFISHRSEFDIFFTKPLLESYRGMHLFFLNGHIHHMPALQDKYLLPIIILSMLILFKNRRLNNNESLLIWILILLSFVDTIWQTLLVQKYSIPILMLFISIFIYKSKSYKIIGFLLLFLIFLSIFAAFNFYDGFKILLEFFPILKSLNLSRAAFISSFLWGILISFSTIIFFLRIRFSIVFVLLFLILQTIYSYNRNYYQVHKIQGYASFKDYYAIDLFKKLKQELPISYTDNKFVAYSLEPAVLLYNSLHTVDGYCANYPLQYKHKFRKVIASYLDQNTTVSNAARKLYDKWGGKVYLLDFYKKDTVRKKISFNTSMLCNLNTNYLLSSIRLTHMMNKKMTLIKYLKGTKSSWDIYVYKLQCN